jgi:hypothetical protein
MIVDSFRGGHSMANKVKTISIKMLIIVAVCIFLGGYVIGSFAPVTTLASAMSGASRGGPGGGNHRN